MSNKLTARRSQAAAAAVVIGLVGVAVVVIIAAVVHWNRQEKKRRARADEEIERYLREHPDREITDEVRKAYYRYRSTHRKGPPGKPEKATDEDGVERSRQYAPTFHAWLPLYLMYPTIYNGHSDSGGGGSGGGSSFGGGGGFTGGGASGTF